MSLYGVIGYHVFNSGSDLELDLIPSLIQGIGMGMGINFKGIGIELVLLKTPDRSLFSESHNPTNTTRWNNDVLMLAQRLRRWPNIKTALFQRIVFARNALPVKLIHSCGVVLVLSASATFVQ